MQLRNYQQLISTHAAEMLKAHHIAYLAMEVRTGKTITALSTAHNFGAKNVLFVTKKKAIQSILDDYQAINASFDLAVVNYESLHKYESSPDLIILDEAHCLGQFPVPAERTKLLKKICKDLPIIYLSGTPTPESYSQLYHQFWVSSYSPFKEWATFYKWANAGFVIPDRKYIYNKEFTLYGNAVKPKIDDLTKHLFITFTQKQAGFKESVKEEVIRLKMQNSTYYLADRLSRDRVFIGKDNQEILADTEVKLMQKLHQIYSGTVISEDGNAIVFDRSKANFIKEHFKGKKIAIFYKYKAEAMAILWEFGVENLTSSPEEFNRSDNKIFYSQIQSGREGINLSTADAIVMYNIDYSSVSYQQARARMQVKERSKEAMLYWIFSDNGIEHKIYDVVKSKQDYTLSYFLDDYKIFSHTLV